MRMFAVVLLMALGFSAQAAPIMIDFDEVAPDSLYDVAGLTVTSQGYTFTTGAYSPNGPYASEVDSTGISVEVDATLFGPPANALITMERQDGGVFGVHSMVVDWSPFDLTFQGVLGGGAAVTLSLATIGTGDWLNLKSLTLDQAIPNAGFGAVRLDDVVVSAVPVPAAAWLFGSALLGMGWFRNKAAR